MSKNKHNISAGSNIERSDASIQSITVDKVVKSLEKELTF